MKLPGTGCCCRGFTLIELLIGLAIAAILLVLAVPTYVRWIADAEVGSAASSIADALRSAQAEAIKRNANVEFTLLPASGWSVQMPGGSTIREGAFSDGAKGPSFTPEPSSSRTVTFNPFSQIESPNASAPTDPLTGVQISSTAGSRTLRVLVGDGMNGIRVCDTNANLPSTDPQRCP
jgi:type IV fimbrial biogenesis protein FimT